MDDLQRSNKHFIPTDKLVYSDLYYEKETLC
jgi:hypothetical protein